MFGVIFSVAFLVVALFAMLIGALKAKKKVWQFSVVRMVQTAVSAVLGALVSSAIAWYGIGAAVDSIDLGEVSGLLSEVPSLKDALAAIVAMIVAPILFLPVYLIIRALTRIFTKMLTRLLVKLTTKKQAEKKEPEAAPAEETADKAAGQEYFEKLSEEAAAPVESKKEKKKRKKAEFKLQKGSWISALCGAACGLITLCVISIPLVGTLGVVSDVASVAMDTVAEQDEGAASVSEAIDALGNNAGTVTVKVLGGGLIYDMMTSYKVGGYTATLRHEASVISSFTGALMTMSDENADKDTKAAGFRDISKAFDKSTLFPVLFSELASAASEDWKNGEAFHGIEMPTLGEGMDPLMVAMFESFADSNVETVKEDVRTITDIFAVLIEKEAMDNFGDDPMAMFSDEETMSAILFDLLENERLYVLVDGFSDFGLSMLMSNMGVTEDTKNLYPLFTYEISDVNSDIEEVLFEEYAEIFDSYGLRVGDEIIEQLVAEKLNGGDVLAWVAANVVADEADFVKKTEIVSVNSIIDGKNFVADRKKEAKNLAHAFAVITNIMDDLSGDVENTIHELGPVLDSFADTKTIGEEKTALILKAILQSDTVHNAVGLTVMEADDTADSMSESAATKGYTAVLNSLEKIVNVMNAAADEGKDTKAAVKELLDDLTPESAKVISNLSSPNVVVNYGVKKESAKPISGLVSDTFTNLADARENGMSDEDYDKESHAVSDMMNVLMSTGNGGRVFGEGSRTGSSAEDFVNNIMDSTVMIGTVVEKVYVDGDQPTVDPMLTESEMDEDEMADFMTALNDRYQASDKTEQTEMEIISVAALMNVEVAIVDGNVVTAATPEVLPA